MVDKGTNVTSQKQHKKEANPSLSRYVKAGTPGPAGVGVLVLVACWW